MLYVGLYQSRTIQHLWCPVFGKGCQVVADAPFARPFGIPDGYIAAALYGIILLLLLGPVEKLWIWTPLLVLVGPLSEAPAELAEQYGRMHDKEGNVANILAVHSLNPPALQAHFDLYRTIMFGRSELTRAQREMVAVVVSSTNRCRY
jgi:hypothetical protein